MSEIIYYYLFLMLEINFFRSVIFFRMSVNKIVKTFKLEIVSNNLNPKRESDKYSQ